MSSEAEFPQSDLDREADRLGQRPASARPVNKSWRDRLEIAARDGRKLFGERAAIAASTGRAQVERGQTFVTYHARERPLLITGVAATFGVALGLALGRGRRRRP